jgi:hypothetical protein
MFAVNSDFSYRGQILPDPLKLFSFAGLSMDSKLAQDRRSAEAIMERRTLSYVWRQKATPVALRRTGRGEKHRVRLPFADDNRQWLQNGRRTTPEWLGGDDAYWELPKSWFNDFVDRALRRYGKVYIIQPYREQEICARACQEAQGHECQCSCMGANHGMGNDGSWFEVSDTFSTRWGERELACRLLSAR